MRRKLRRAQKESQYNQKLINSTDIDISAEYIMPNFNAEGVSARQSPVSPMNDDFTNESVNQIAAAE